MARELINMDFRTMIGGPLTAAIKAQSDASLAAVDFIKQVGINDDGEPEVIEFKYTKKINNIDEEFVFEVPLLTVAPIPNIAIKEVRIEFNAKISSVDVQTDSTANNFGVSAEVKARWGWGSAKLNASFSRQKKSSSKSEMKKEYSLSVSVLATQDDPPPGIALMVEILEGLIEPAPTS